MGTRITAGDILFEAPLYSPSWVRLARRKWYGCSGPPGSSEGGDCHISADEFDRVLGHCTAVTDAAGSVFAAELVEAYPEAKVVLNVRRDEEAWLESVEEMVLRHSYENWVLWTTSWFQVELFWGVACLSSLLLARAV